jgi:DNA (cytosine-5)-methyltransferase 1
MSRPGEKGSDGSRVYSADSPAKTLTTRNNTAVIGATIVDLAHTSDRSKGADSVDEPIRTLTTCDTMSSVFLVLEDGRRLDIYMRMLEPEELARAHSLPDGFILCGNRTERTKQIGNSVPARTAKALCLSVLKELVA